MRSVNLMGVGTISRPPEAVQRAKLVDASEKFEAMMLSQMLKPLQFGASPDAGDDENSGGAADTVRGMATEALGKALSQHGGMGIARSVLQQVMAEENSRGRAGEESGNEAGHPAGHEWVEQKKTEAKVQ